MNAPRNLTVWMSAHQHKDKNLIHIYRYHSRSDAHSIELCELIMRDILQSCPVLKDQASRGKVAYGINVEHYWSTSRKAKGLDLAVGIPLRNSLPQSQIFKVRSNRRKSGESPSAARNVFSEVLIACEAKAVMTEHGKSQPRLFDELSSSHEIVHQGNQNTIATGIVMVNVASKFASPLRQKDETIAYSTHKQPYVTERMINHLRGLQIREKVGEVGFDAFSTFVVDCDNQNLCTLHEEKPAPQVGERDHYGVFIERIAKFYNERFSTNADLIV
jgi:hypothetical protein